MTILGEMLQDAGHHVVSVASGAEALRVFVPDRFDVVITHIGMERKRMREVVRLTSIRMLLTAALVGVLSTGCARVFTENLLGQARQTLVDRYEQELGNIAMFLVVPDGLPQYIRINRGTVEARPEPRWSIGTDTFIAGGTRMALVWEIASVTDPGDLERLRLMFRWVTRHIEFDELERSWNEIRDQPEYTADAKQRFDSQGARC